MCGEPLNPYERYERTGLTDAELGRELREKEEYFWDNFPDWGLEDEPPDECLTDMEGFCDEVL